MTACHAEVNYQLVATALHLHELRELTFLTEVAWMPSPRSRACARPVSTARIQFCRSRSRGTSRAAYGANAGGVDVGRRMTQEFYGTSCMFSNKEVKIPYAFTELVSPRDDTERVVGQRAEQNTEISGRRAA